MDRGFGSLEDAIQVAEDVRVTLNGYNNLEEEETRNIAISLFSGEKNLASYCASVDDRIRSGFLTGTEVRAALDEKKRQEEEAARIKSEKRKEKDKVRREHKKQMMEGSAKSPLRSIGLVVFFCLCSANVT